MSIQIRSKLSKLIAVLFIFVFVYTGTSKLMEFRLFELTLRRSPLLSAIPSIVALALPAIELIAATLLISTKTMRTGFYASFVLMMLFTSYVLYMILFTPQLPCSCGGVLQSMTWNEHLVFNLFLSGLACLGIVLENRKSQLKGLNV